MEVFGLSLKLTPNEGMNPPRARLKRKDFEMKYVNQMSDYELAQLIEHGCDNLGCWADIMDRRFNCRYRFEVGKVIGEGDYNKFFRSFVGYCVFWLVLTIIISLSISVITFETIKLWAIAIWFLVSLLYVANWFSPPPKTDIRGYRGFFQDLERILDKPAELVIHILEVKEAQMEADAILLAQAKEVVRKQKHCERFNEIGNHSAAQRARAEFVEKVELATNCYLTTKMPAEFLRQAQAELEAEEKARAADTVKSVCEGCGE